MGNDSLMHSFLRHVETVLLNIDYTDLSCRGSRAANAYRLAKKELYQLKKKETSRAAGSSAADKPKKQ